MRRWWLVILLLLCADPAAAVTVRVTWTARPASEGVVTYKVYAGPGSNCGPGQSAVFGTVSSPTITFTGEITLSQPTTYRFCVTGLDQAGNEGTPSVAVAQLLNPYWTETFEDTTLPFWAQSPSGLNGTITVSSLQAVSGTRSLRFVFADTTRVSGPTLQRTVPTGTELYSRFWLRATPGFTWGAPSTTLGVFGGGSTAPLVSLVTNPAVSGAPFFQIQTAKEAGYGTESLFQNQGTPATVGNSWVCYETRVKYNTPGTANGIFQLWAAGVLKADYQNREVLGPNPSDPAPSTATLSYVRLYNDRGSGELYIDDLQVSNNRLGCDPGETPPVNPTVIAPTNLRFDTGTSPSNIAHDTTQALTAGYSTNSVNGSITIGAGSDRALLAACQARDGTAANRPISTVTLGAQSLTRLRADRMTGAGADTEWWGLLSPNTGAGTLTATATGSIAQLACVGISLQGVDSGNFPAGVTGTVDPTASASKIATLMANTHSNAWILDTTYTFNEYGITVGAGQTERNKRNLFGAGFSAYAGVSSVGPLAANVTQEMFWEYTAPAIDRQFVQSLVLLAPIAGSSSTDVLKWNDNASDETGYQLEWKHDGTNGQYQVLATLAANTTQYPNPITTQTAVSFRVKTLRGSDASEYSNILSTVPGTEPEPEPGPPIETPPGTTPPPITTPTPVPTTSSGKLTNGRTVLSWNTTNITDAKKSTYIVEWTNQTLGTSNWQAIGLTSANATGFVHRYPPFVPAGETRFWVCYRVKAKTPAGLSGYSEPTCGDVDVVVPASPPAVQVPDGPTALSLQ